MGLFHLFFHFLKFHPENKVYLLILNDAQAKQEYETEPSNCIFRGEQINIRS